MNKMILSAAIVLLTSVASQAQVVTKNGGKTTINTTTLTNAYGFRGKTPLLVTFENDKITNITPLHNRETPKHFARIKKELLPKFIGMKASKARKATKVDGVTGATFSSSAVKENIKAAAKYYRK
jgi:electron transport complex protein RnfG